MADQYQRPYVESSVFIGWIKNEVIEGVERGRIAAHVLTQAERGTFRIHTSALTLAEVHKKRREPMLTPDEDETILTWFEHEFVEIIAVDREIGEQANRFCREYNIPGNDAIHLASALRARCDVLLSWDRDLLKISRPDVRVEEPRMIGQLSLPDVAEPSGTSGPGSTMP